MSLMKKRSIKYYRASCTCRIKTISREEIAERVSKTVRTVQRALVSLTEKDILSVLEQRKTPHGKC